jgi:hypothetical protein
MEGTSEGRQDSLWVVASTTTTTTTMMNSSSCSQEISLTQFIEKNVHYPFHNNPPLAPVLNQMKPTHAPPPPSVLFKIHSNIILALTPHLPRSMFPSGFPTETLYAFHFSPIRATCASYLILLYIITQII